MKADKIIMFTHEGKLGLELERMNEAYAVTDYRDFGESLPEFISTDIVTEFIRYHSRDFPVVNLYEDNEQYGTNIYHNAVKGE